MRILIVNRYSDNFADHGKYLGHARYQISGVTIADHVPMTPPGQGRIELAEDVHDAPVP